MTFTECKPRYPTRFMQHLAVQIKNNTSNKTYKYDIFDGMYSGICIILEVTYNSLFEEFNLVIKDINTGSHYIIDRCHIYLKEITIS